MLFPSALLLFLSLAYLYIPSIAQDGGVSGPTSSPQAANYSCDASKCKLPTCHCASSDPPGGLDPSDVPMFLVFTADDAIQSYTINAVNSLLANRINPNGCPIKMSYYTSTNFTNYTLVTDWYVAGNEIADHTMTHVGNPPMDEIQGNLIALNSLAGIPFSSIQGFRAPFLNYSADMLQRLKQAGFTYDTSATSTAPVTDPNTDAFWPYTLDHGLANNCLTVPNICSGKPEIPGFWEIPMYALFDNAGGIHLMDPWLDTVPGNDGPNDQATLNFLQSTFLDHYTGKRQPFGIYTHPIHIAADFPGVASPVSTVNMINTFLDFAQEQQDVWIVSNEQVLAWMKNPVPKSQLNTLDAFKCTVPQVSENICNGMPAVEAGLVQHCAFNDFPFYTCYGCPTIQPTPGNANPPQAAVDGQPLRTRLPSNCTTAFWDPIGAKCLCQGNACKFQDNTKAIGPNGANLTSGRPSAGESSGNSGGSNTSGGVVSRSRTTRTSGILLGIGIASSCVIAFSSRTFVLM